MITTLHLNMLQPAYFILTSWFSLYYSILAIKLFTKDKRQPVIKRSSENKMFLKFINTIRNKKIPVMEFILVKFQASSL